MPVLLSILILLLLENTVAAVRPEVSFKPNWARIFTGESLTLTCNVASKGNEVLEYTWFKDNKQQPTRTKHLLIQSAETQQGGNYQCRSRTSDISDEVRLDVSYDWLILQVPHSVYEGDSISLRCHSKNGQGAERTVFYNKENKVLQDSENESMPLNNITLSMAGAYRCNKVISDKVYLDEAMLSVKDLFSEPQIFVSQFAPSEGANVTVACDTSISLLRAATELQFAFYRNGQNVQDFGSSHNYQIYPAELGDTGDFSCEVKSSTSGTKKLSRATRIQIFERFSFPHIKSSLQEVTEGVLMTLTCETITQNAAGLLFAFYRNDEMVQGSTSSNVYLVQAAQLEDSGNHTCEVRTSDYSVKKRSQALHIQIQELFSYPEIKLTTGRATFTLKCDTILTVRGQSAELQFAFYRNGENAQEFGSSNKYMVQTDLPGVSGDFACEVKTANGGVRKRSPGLSILNQGSTNYTSHNTIRMVLSVCIFIITLCIIYHHVKSEEKNQGRGDQRSLQVAWSIKATVS